MTDKEITEIDKRLSLQEQEVKYIREDISEVKNDMKEHIQMSKSSNDKLHTKMDMIIWAMVIGMAGIMMKLIFFTK
jgi:type VI protein secretion system component VasK